MALTADEERRVRLLLDFEDAKATLNKVIKVKDLELRTEMSAIQATVEAKHDADITAARSDFDAAEAALKAEMELSIDR